MKHDGWRIQLHKAGDDVVIYSKTGADFTKRFRSIAHAVMKLSATSCILDAAVVACDEEGNSNFGEAGVAMIAQWADMSAGAELDQRVLVFIGKLARAA